MQNEPCLMISYEKPYQMVNYHMVNYQANWTLPYGELSSKLDLAKYRIIKQNRPYHIVNYQAK